jgi:probable O-glycosylation ligase (exosortase A-associated)
VLLVIAFSLGLESAKQGWAQMILNPGATNSNTLPMLGDNNFVAVGMMMLLPLFIALARTAKTPWERALHWFFIIGVLYRGVSTYSRGGFLALCAMGLLALWQSPRRIRSLIAIAIVIAVVAPVMPQAFWDRMKTIAAAEEDLDASQQGRLYFWEVAKIMGDRKPVTGVGFNGYQRSYRNYNPLEGEFGYRRSVHSAWFGVLAEMGYPGLFLLVAIIVLALLSAWRIRASTRGDPELADIRVYASAVQMSLVAYVVGMTFLHGQYLEMFWHTIGLGVALQRIHAGLVEAVPVKAQARPAAVPALGAYQRS